MLSLKEFSVRVEGQEYEVKEAQGRHGQGEVPDSIWKSYSGMANTNGGTIYLGAAERADGSLKPLGIKDHARIKKELWDTLNDREKVSANILSHGDITTIRVDGTADPVVEMTVPKAGRSHRPVYIGENPLTGTYKRQHEGDYKCRESEVRRMIADAEKETRDDKLLVGYDWGDINNDTFEAYRNDFKSTSPHHPALNRDDEELLEWLGGYKEDRQSEEEGLTIAGLLMFGKLKSIEQALPMYKLDYQERINLRRNQRWSHRIHTDGTWSGNIYDFYRKVRQRLTEDLEVPFQTTKPGKRIDHSPVHEAVVEALVNTLIHADYRGRIPVLIEKHPKKFTFRNPGDLRLPKEEVFKGGKSDCRNRNLQKMFQMVGVSEQAGSGFPTILSAWDEQHWRRPDLREEVDPPCVQLTLEMASLFPDETIEKLSSLYEEFESLSYNKRVALATAKEENSITNGRLRDLVDLSQNEARTLLQELVRQGFLEDEGTRGGSYYELVDEDEDEPEDDVERHSRDVKTEEELLEIASPVREKGWSKSKEVEDTIVKLCRDQWLSVEQLASLLDRKPATIRNNYIASLVEQGDLVPKYPNTTNHPKQAYKAT